ncbi:hypothetical protein RB595_006569 [Gaeumannomyces hyphopodioides]
MASYSSPARKPTPSKGTGRGDDGDLANSLRHLSITQSRSSPNAAHLAARSSTSMSSRSPISPSNRSPSSMSVRGPASRASLGAARPESRADHPNLLRKASLNSIRSASAMGAAPLRRASSVKSPNGPRSPLSPSPPEAKPAPTAASVASDYFRTELAVRHGERPDPTSETVVIMHDSCYGHRYSRPRTSKVGLSTIVERPERLKASALGVAVAYVRLGERHADGANPIHPRLDPASIVSIPFRIHKTTRRLSLNSQTVTNVHGTKWMEELKQMCETAESKLATNGKELARPEMSRGPDQQGAPPKFHEGDLYLCAESLDALEGSLGGVCEAVDAVFSHTNPARRAFVAIRPPGHHCSASYPSGFCWVNNVHVGIMHAIQSHGLTHAAIIDFDLHHGDGSQAIAWQHNARSVGLAKNAAWWKKTSIGYFSLHDINSYPCEMGDEEKVKNASLCIENAHGQNIWNVHLMPWKTEADFWRLYETKYSILLEKTREFLRAQTDRFRSVSQNVKGAIFLSAGFDASEHEGSGMQRHNVNVPTEFYARLTRDVVKIAAEEGTSVDGRVISVLEGGYSDRALSSGILSHLSGLAGDDPAPTAKQDQFNGLAFDMGQKLGGTPSHSRKTSLATHSRRESLNLKNTIPLTPYEPAWWSLAELEHLEATMAPPPSIESKKPRNLVPPTYSSPTQSSQAKASYTPKVRRSFSGMSLSPTSRAPSPPPPDVPWATAAYELSKLLIPGERQTDSCTHDDLNAEATRQRRDRQSVALADSIDGPASAAAPAPVPTRMSLRERKVIKSYVEEDEKEFLKASSRRKTVAGTSVLASEKATARGVPSTGAAKSIAPARRLSDASAVLSEVPEKPPVPQTLTVNTPAGRPGTSQSIRPESSASVRALPGAGNSLAVKKTRTVAAKKEAPVKATRAVKKTSPPLKPSNVAAKAAAPAPTTATAQPTSSAASVASRARAFDSASASSRAGSTAATSTANDDMDGITSGFKKIKITLLTKEQKEAREKAEKAKSGTAATKPGNKGPSVATPTEERHPPVLVTGSAPERIQSSSSGAKKANKKEKDVTPAPSPTLAHANRPPALSPANSHSSPTTIPPGPLTPDVFVPFQPEGPSPKAVPQQQPALQWLPPNTGTPSPMKRQELPVFTSMSAIPFAGPSPQAPGATTNPAGGSDGPETPRQK